MAKHALVIGITQYDYPYNFQSLTKPVHDAEAVARLLDERGGFQKVTRLPEGWNYDRGCPQVAADRVTSEQLMQALQTFLEEAGRGDALIYFSGHGFVVPDKLNQRQNRKKGYLVTSDSQIETIAVHGIPFDSLNDFFHNSNLNSLVLLLDCCHAGSYLERDLVEQTLTAFGSQKDYYLMAACRATEKAYEGEPEQENSVFTAALLEGLAQERADQDGQISCDRLFDFIYKNQKLRNFGQQPIRLGLGGSITLVTYLIENKEPAKLNLQNPYQGLRAFESAQANYFYGRDRVIRELLVRLNKDRFLSVIGPSGSGKSSVVKAGLLPQLKSNRIAESSQWEIESFTPGRHPLTPLQEIFARQHRRKQPYVLFIDQFEEVFTLCENEEERQTFLRLITDEATSTERLARVIWAMRGDFLDRCAAYPEPATLINSIEPRTYIVPPFSLRELEEAIKKPAERHGVTFEEGLIAQILEDVEGEPGALPLLQYALSQLWRVCVGHSASEQPQLTQKGYKEIGGVKGALNETANSLYKSLREDQDFIQDLFMQLVEVKEDKVTRCPISWENVNASANSPEQAQRVVGLLANQRLLVTDEKNVQVVHEALLSEWGLLRKWIEDNREDIRLRHRLKEYCREWQESFNQAENALLPDAWLAPIEDWVKRTQHKLKLTPQEVEYLQRSIEKRDHEIQAELARERELRELAEAKAIAEIEKSLEAEARAKAEQEKTEEAKARARAEADKRRAALKSRNILIGFVVLAFALASLASWQSIVAHRNAKFAAIALVEQAEKLLDKKNQLEALVESAKALNILNEIGQTDSQTLKRVQSVIYKVKELNRLESHKDKVLGVSFSSDGQRIVSAGADKKIILWSVEGGTSLDESLEQTDSVWSVRFSHKNKILASSSQDGYVKIWSIVDDHLKNIKTFNQVAGIVYDLSFSPNDQIIAYSSIDGIIRLGKIYSNSNQPFKLLDAKQFIQGRERNQTYKIYSLDFHPNGQTIAYGGDEDGRVSLWDWQSNSVPRLLDEGENTISMIRYSPDGTILASANNDGTIKLWDVKNNYKLMGKIKAYKKYIFGLAFSDDSKNIVSSSINIGETIKIWSIEQAKQRYNLKQPSLEKPLEILIGHTEYVNRIEFNPTRTDMIVSSSNDTTVRLWKWKVKSSSKDNSQVKSLLQYSCNAIWNYLNTNNRLEEVRKTCANYKVSKIYK